LKFVPTFGKILERLNTKTNCLIKYNLQIRPELIGASKAKDATRTQDILGFLVINIIKECNLFCNQSFW